MVGQRCHVVEAGPHVEPASVGTGQRQIHRDAARMAGPDPRIGDEGRVGQGSPQDPLGLDRPKTVEDRQAQSLSAGEFGRAPEPVGRFGMQQAYRLTVDRPPRDVVRCGVTQIEIDVEALLAYLDEAHDGRPY